MCLDNVDNLLPFQLNVPQSSGFTLQTQVGVRVQESGARVSFHQQVNVSLSLVEAGEARLLQALLDLLSDVVVNINLEGTSICDV